MKWSSLKVMKLNRLHERRDIDINQPNFLQDGRQCESKKYPFVISLNKTNGKLPGVCT